MRTTILVLLLVGCHPQPKPKPIPDPGPDPVASDCELMCRRIGPTGLNCEEGQPVYDSDVPGPRGEPNVSCAAFCERQEAEGVKLNPRCVAQVQSCEEIEPARNQCGR